jgi:hypothetical protein
MPKRPDRALEFGATVTSSTHAPRALRAAERVARDESFTSVSMIADLDRAVVMRRVVAETHEGVAAR